MSPPPQFPSGSKFAIGDDFRLRMRPAGGDAASRLGAGICHVYHLARAVCVGRGLDVGGSYWSADSDRGLPGAVVVDPTLAGTGTAEDLSQYHGRDFDYVFSSHTLEHLPAPEAFFHEVVRVLRPGGVLFLYLPYPGHPPWDPAISPTVRGEHKWQPDPQAVGRLLLIHGFTVDYLEWAEDDLHSFTAIGRHQGAAAAATAGV